MRSEGNDAVVDCDDPVIALACNLDSEDCPAACKSDSKNEEKNSDEVVKAGNLDVTTSGESNGRVFIGRASDLDTITLKTSEEVTISKIILERIGYSTKDNIDNVRLEDENGTKIADEKTLDSKGQVKLTLKKDYKVVDGELNATIVVKTHKGTSGDKNNLEAGGTVGFKVVDVESTAKDVNISGKANTYTAIAYDGSKMTLIVRTNKEKEYNWTASELYEVAKFKVNTPDDSSILLRGFTFKNGATTNTLDLRKYFDNAELTIAGEKVSGLNASVNKNDELVVTFKEIEVPAKEKAEVILKIALVEDFDVFPSNVRLDLTDYVAVDGKVESRVAAYDADNHEFSDSNFNSTMTSYVFKWGKVKLSNVKLGNVDAPQDSEGIIVAEGSITIPEAINAKEFTIKAKGDWASFIKQMTVVVNGEETDASSSCTAVKANPATSDECTFKFTNVEIEKSGKVQFKIDVRNSKVDKQTVTFTTFNADAFADGTKWIVYDESGKSAKSEVSGSITFSKVTLQPARASMTNSNIKDQEFANRDSQRKTIFNGEYTAKKGDVKLNEFLITANDATGVNKAITSGASADFKNKVTFYVFVDDMDNEVADAKLSCNAAGTWCTASDTFDKVLVKNGETVKVKVEAEVEADNKVNTDGDMLSGSTVISNIDLGKYKVEIWWEDENGNDNSWRADATSAKLKVVNKGSVSVTTGKTKQTIVKKANDAKLAEFIIKPAKGSESVDLEEISFKLSDNSIDPSKITLKVDGMTEDDYSNGFTYSMNREVKEAWVTVLITLDNEEDAQGTITLSDLKVNGKAQSKTFSKKFVPAAVEIIKQSSSNGSTVFTLDVDADSDTDVANFAIYTTKSWNAVPHKTLLGTFEDGKTVSITNEKDKAYELTKVAYLYSEESNGHNAGCYDIGDTAAAPRAETGAADCTQAGGVWADTGYVWNQITITNTELPDYFKIDDVDIKVMSN